MGGKNRIVLPALPLGNDVQMRRNINRKNTGFSWIFHPEVHVNADVDILLMVHESTEKRIMTVCTYIYIPYAPCMEYLPTCALKITQSCR